MSASKALDNLHALFWYLTEGNDLHGPSLKKCQNPLCVAARKSLEVKS
jgi:hypothetical protein